jgi:hypothetical protein
MRRKKTTKEIVELFQHDTDNILFKPINHNKFLYYDEYNNDTAIVILGLDGCILKILRETFFPETTPCPLFDFCNCKTAMCRVALPDDSCHWYRYFKALIKEREEEI